MLLSPKQYAEGADGNQSKLHAEASCSPFIHEDEARAYLAGENKRFTLSPIKVSE